jgi:mannose-6-phosphate isomerase-like protein (cupin superfamily)
MTSGDGYALGASDSRPWGHWSVIAVGSGYAVKQIVVLPGGRLSLQRHQGRDEHWVVVAGRARVTRDAMVNELGPNESVHIPAGTAHRLENVGDGELRVIEVQCGADLREDDIVRLEDAYGRA